MIISLHLHDLLGIIGFSFIAGQLLIYWVYRDKI
ncbi:Protein of unknown function [Lactobacillus equicursoris DSM 19284 = JCM 14600 = CIP 110162]|nr:Protein of unknown function [Lactobacillus equicursoris DSM 19284 = JCM 14600 = CIP 110162]